MTAEEIGIMDMLGDVQNAFVELMPEHPADVEDFTYHIHALQNILLSREGLRVYRSLTNAKDKLA